MLNGFYEQIQKRSSTGFFTICSAEKARPRRSDLLTGKPYKDGRQRALRVNSTRASPRAHHVAALRCANQPGKAVNNVSHFTTALGDTHSRGCVPLFAVRAVRAPPISARMTTITRSLMVALIVRKMPRSKPLGNRSKLLAGPRNSRFSA